MGGGKSTSMLVAEYFFDRAAGLVITLSGTSRWATAQHNGGGKCLMTHRLVRLCAAFVHRARFQGWHAASV